MFEGMRQDPSPAAVANHARTRAQCPLCWGQRAIWEASVLGLMPVVCEGCRGTGHATR